MNYEQSVEYAITRKTSRGCNRAQAMRDFMGDVLDPRYRYSIEQSLVHHGYATPAMARKMTPALFERVSAM